MEISAEELKERVAIVKRFRELLMEQRQRFSDYLAALEKQTVAIEKGSAEDILVHVELEEKMLSDIFSVQKVLRPLEPLYRASLKNVQAPDVEEIQSTLESLKTKASAKVKYNRDILEKRMNELREEIKILRNNPYARRYTRFSKSDNASFVDING